MTKIPARHTFGKSSLKIFSRNKKKLTLKRGIQHLCLEAYEVFSKDYPKLTKDLLRKGQIEIPMHLYGKILKSYFCNY